MRIDQHFALIDVVSSVFARFQIGEITYSCLIPATSQEEVIEIANNLQFRLDEKKARLLTLLRLPTAPIPKFPFFTACGMVLDWSRIIGDQLAQNYWNKYANDKDSMAGWIKDFLRFRREIIFAVAPEFESEAPHVLPKQMVFVLHDPLLQRVVLRYYRGTSYSDIVQVKVAPEAALGIPHFDRGSSVTQDLFAKYFTLPPRSELLQEITYFTHILPKVYYNWEYPYFAAAAELMKYVENHNQRTRQIYQDATYLTEARLQNWLSNDLKTKRQIMERFPELTEIFGKIANPVHIVSVYRLSKPMSGIVRDGKIDTYYFRSIENQVDTFCVEDDDAAAKLLAAFLAEKGKETLQHLESSSISYFLRVKLGGP